MGQYLPNTEEQRQEMMEAIGIQTLEELYAAAPAHLLMKEGPDIPAGMAELGLRRAIEAIAGENIVFSTIFRGAGAYRHYIPAVVQSVVSKETFLTAYTPYQAEISQGILQAIFEYQSMICELTGMDVSNASVYDGATAAAEAVTMCRDRGRRRALVSAAAHPDVIETVQTYCWAADAEMALIPMQQGKTDTDALMEMLDDTVASVYIAQPNYYGMIEDAAQITAIAHEKGAKMIMGVNPIAAAVLQSPGECDADIAVGEGQPLGMPLGFGGPYLGFMAAKSAMARKLPGRIVGETEDAMGNRAYVLTLQAREQHIRREKASSNICSNQAHCAMTAAAYMAAMGPIGMREAAMQSMAKAHYLAERLCTIPGFGLRHAGGFFHEFLTDCPLDADVLLTHLEKQGILGGLPVDGGILWCATELNTKEEIDRLVKLVGEVAQ